MVVKILKRGNSFETEPVVPTVVKKVPNLRQQKVIKLISGNVGKSKAEILRKAGYPPSTVDNPDHVFNSPVIQDAINPIVKKMTKIREKVLNALEIKDFNKQSPYNLTIISNVMTKDVELLSGRPTDRSAYTLPEEEKARLRKLLDKNKKK